MLDRQTARPHVTDSFETADGARLDQFEIRFAHQERSLAELNDVLTAQWRQIAALEREVMRLRDEIQNASPARDGAEPPPPHY